MLTLPPPIQSHRRDAGFSLPELLVSLLVLSVIVTVVTQLTMQMSNGQRTMWNRTQMHSSVRGAIALLQQEVGQAGLVALPGPVMVPGVPAGPAGPTGPLLRTTVRVAPLFSILMVRVVFMPVE